MDRHLGGVTALAVAPVLGLRGAPCPLIRLRGLLMTYHSRSIDDRPGHPLARLLGDPRLVAGAIGLAAAATVGAALVFEHGFGYRPCKLCLVQRWPYYLAVPLSLGTALLPRPAARWGLALLGLLFLVSAGLGIHHAGVEWGFWAGPSDCGGAVQAPAAGVADFLRQLETVRVVSCTEAAWRLLGLSMAGWNALVSAGLAAAAFMGFALAGRRA